MEKNKILVTGAAGFLGSHLAEKLAQMGNNVVGIDNMKGGYADNVPKNIKFYKQKFCFQRVSRFRSITIYDEFPNSCYSLI